MRKFLFWTLALLITLSASVYQRMTGPTHSKSEKVLIDGVEYSFKFPRSGSEQDCRVFLKDFGAYGNISVAPTVSNRVYSASLYWRKYPTEDNFTHVPMIQSKEGMEAYLPVQPHAGKLEYYVVINTHVQTPDGIKKESKMLFKDEPLVIRFKGEVPAAILILHIICMFVSMLFAAYALICAIANIENQYKKYTLISFIIIAIGGFIFGPIVQKYAFDVYWSGFPFGGDLTDNKTLFAAIAMLFAVLTKKMKWNRWAVIAAVLVMFAVFSIPHSMRGSQLNHSTGVIETSVE